VARFVEWAETGRDRSDAVAQTACTVFHAFLRQEGVDASAEDNVMATEAALRSVDPKDT
jgi:hypothetical protein